MQEEVQSTLFGILREAEQLTKGDFVAKPGGQKPPSRQELQEYVEKQQKISEFYAYLEKELITRHTNP